MLHKMIIDVKWHTLWLSSSILLSDSKQLKQQCAPCQYLKWWIRKKGMSAWFLKRTEFWRMWTHGISKDKINMHHACQTRIKFWQIWVARVTLKTKFGCHYSGSSYRIIMIQKCKSSKWWKSQIRREQSF